jgi:SAM-dependent methyltransferase
MRRFEPVSRTFGFDRGTPVDRHYIAAFLEKHRGDVRGDVLEAGDSTYTRRFGTGVRRADVLHVDAGNPLATVVGDLGAGTGIAPESCDCLLLTQVYPFIFDLQAAVRHSRRALREGGVLLATLPGLTQISGFDRDRWGDFWRFTSQGAARLFAAEFGARNVQVAAQGNLLTATALLHGIAAEELTAEELDHRDPDYEVLIAVRAVRTG